MSWRDFAAGASADRARNSIVAAVALDLVDPSPASIPIARSELAARPQSRDLMTVLGFRASLGNPYAGSCAVSLVSGCAAGDGSNCFCRDAIGGNFVQAGTWLGNQRTTDFWHGA
jgi:hypothetical protein